MTFGFFWRDRTYDLYRMMSADGRLLRHRFDVVTDVRIGPGRIEYLDLLLDVLVDPGGEPRVEDEDEVEEAAAAGLLPPDRLSLIDRTRRHLLAQHASIVEEEVQILE